MIKNPETILVTGSAGFIGLHVAKALLERGDTVVGLDNFCDYYDVSLKEDRNKILEKFENFKLERGDLKDLNFVQRVLRDNKIDKVCHLAAQAGVRHSLENPHIYIQSNLVGFVNLIEEVRKAGIESFIYASSSSVYGNNQKIPFGVEDRADQPISLYAATKKANELIAYVYHHLYHLKTTGLRFFTVIGPWGRPDMALFSMTKKILNDQPIDVHNHGRMKRDFTYIDDVTAGVLSALDKSYDCEIFNIGGDNPVELSRFIELLETALAKKAQKKLLDAQPGDVPETYADIKHSRELLGYNPRIAIEQAIKNFVDWYGDYYQVKI